MQRAIFVVMGLDLAGLQPLKLGTDTLGLVSHDRDIELMMRSGSGWCRYS